MGKPHSSPGTTDGLPPSIRLVDDADGLEEALDAVTDEVVGVDVERADSHRYHRRAALIQVGDADACVLVDPLAFEDLGALDAFLTDRLTVLHALENDLVPLAAAGVRPHRVADTGVAAVLLGLPIGLGDLLSEVLDVELDGDKERFQRADWERRPIPPPMAAYAAGDVRWLPALWRELARRLDEAGRTGWYEQQLESLIAGAHEDRRDWKRTRGAGRLDPAERSILRHLWEEREAIAREHDIAPGRLLRDATMLDLASDPAAGPGALVRRNRRRSGPLRHHADRLFDAQQRGRDAAPEPPAERRRRTDLQRRAYDALRSERNRLADQLGIDAGVLCPGRTLWRIVHAQPSDPATLAAAADLRPWQREVLAHDLWRAYEQAVDADGVDGSGGGRES